jgi:hypothetical protein
LSASTPSVYGVKETLAVLRSLDPALYREAMKQIRSAAEPMAAEIRSSLPGSPPLSGFGHSGRTGWTKSGTKVSVKVGGRRPRTKTTWPLARVVLAGAGASIYDMAGAASASRLSAALSARWGGASRSVWPAAQRKMPEVQKAVLEAVDRVADQANTRLVRR